jgi:hypothetical protein
MTKTTSRLLLIAACLAFTVGASPSADVRAPRPPVISAEAAQVPAIVNPSGVAFTPSSDNDVIENGVALVTKYTLEFFNVTAPTTVVKTVDIGKPATVAGEISWMQLAAVRVTLSPGSYTVNVYAEGPGGRSGAASSDPFTVAVRSAAAPGKPRWIR